MLDIYSYYHKMQDEKVILYFKGEITNNLLTSILQLVDDKLERKESVRIKRKVFSILLECLQNIYNYHQQKDFSDEKSKSAILVIKKSEEAYTISTGNYLKNEKVEKLKKKIEKVNRLNQEELKEFYKEVLSRQEPSETGGAGLGLIDMARKSGEKISYEFNDADTEKTFYTLEVKVPIQNTKS